MTSPLQIAEQRTLERFNVRQDRIANNQGYGATVGAVAITESYCSKLSTVIQRRLQSITQSLSARDHQWQLKGFSYVVRNLDPDVLAAATLTALLHSIALGGVLRPTVHGIGAAVQAECWSAGLLAHSERLHGRIKRAVQQRHGNIKYRAQAARSIAKRAGYRGRDWTRAEIHQAGGFLLDCALEALGDMVHVEYVSGAATHVQIRPEALALAEAAVEEALTRKPMWAPSVELPQPWTGFNRGGYWDERTRLTAPIVRAYHKETIAAVRGAMRDGSMQAHVDGVNALQSVPWKINVAVLDAVQWCYSHNVLVPGLPAQEDLAEPERLSDADWQDTDHRRLHRYRKARVLERNRGLGSERVLLSQDIETARSLLAQSAFYTPCNSDWRGRVYSVPHFSFTRDDRVRALFLFARGMPIGAEGLYWLKVHVANCGDFGKISKRPFAERVAWVDQNAERIKAIAWDPKSPQSIAWWTTADKPFLFLAGCAEIAAVLSGGASHVTCLPVSFDGSCSGLQHLCAMTRASEGSLVNLTPQTEPQDVYQTVADLVRTRISADLKDVNGAAGLARLCLEAGITRKLVKRNVMTYSYSSHEYGMAEQHREDTMKPLELDVLAGIITEHPYAYPDDTRENADGSSTTVVGRTAAKYLAGHIYRAIETVVQRPAQAMAFLQRCVKALAHEGKPLSWITPTGLPWSNRYHTPIIKRVELWLRDHRVRLNVADGSTKPIDKEKASNGVAPNFVHACDAAHLIRTVNAAVREGIVDLATVHDSFGCLAPQALRFRQIIREQFVQMYEEHDVLAEVLAAAKRDLTNHNWDRLPAVPAAGPLNLREVLNAEYAFA